jgi:hypothetical protein
VGKTRIPRCLNCGADLDPNLKGIDAKRFCTFKCKEDYFERDFEKD